MINTHNRTESPQIASTEQPAGITPTNNEQRAVRATEAAALPKIPRLRTAKKQALMIKALERTGGHITNSAKLAGIDRRTHSAWMLKFPSYAAKVDEIEAKRLDDAQAVVDLATMDYKSKPELAVKAAMFTLEHLGGKLGYQRPGAQVQVNTQVNAEIGGPIGELIRLQEEHDQRRKENQPKTP